MPFSRKVFVKIDGVPQFDQLRVSFNIHKSLTPNINTASITVYNLDKATRRSLIDDSTHKIELFAGYEQATRIFVGNTFDVRSSAPGGDTVTRIQCGDGDEARELVTNESFGPQISPLDIVRTLASNLQKAGVGIGNLNQAIAEGRFSAQSQFAAFKNGYATSSQTIQALTVILRGFGLGWTIQDNEILILEPAGVLREPPIVLKEALLSDGTFRVDNKTVLAKTFIDSRIRPGIIAAIDYPAEELSLQGRCNVVRYVGDNWGQAWYTIAEVQDISTLEKFDYIPLQS